MQMLFFCGRMKLLLFLLSTLVDVARKAIELADGKPILRTPALHSKDINRRTIHAVQDDENLLFQATTLLGSILRIAGGKLWQLVPTECLWCASIVLLYFAIPVQRSMWPHDLYRK